MILPQITSVRVARTPDGTGADLVFETPDGPVTVPLSFAWASADLYASLYELVDTRKKWSAHWGRPWQGTDGRYLRAVAAIRKADGSP